MTTLIHNPGPSKESALGAPNGSTWLENLGNRCYEFDFFQAVRLLDVHFGQRQFPRIGYSQSRQGDPIHFGQRPFMEFAPRTLDCWSEGAVDACRFHRLNGEEFVNRPALLVYFVGFFGPNGALPLHLTEHALERERKGDYCFTNFANIFQHRFLAFFYRAWACCRIAVDLDRSDRQRFARLIGSLVGTPERLAEKTTPAVWILGKTGKPLGSSRQLGEPEGLQAKPPTNGNEAWARLFFAGHLVSQRRNAEGLASILSRYFGVPSSVLTFFGRWLELPTDCLSRLGNGSGQTSLGGTFLLGFSVWDCQGSFRVRMGPLKLLQLERLLPGSVGAERLKKWVAEYVGPELKWDLQLVLAKEEVPFAKLDGSITLGFTMFLHADPAVDDVETIIVDLQEPQGFSQNGQSAEIAA